MKSLFTIAAIMITTGLFAGNENKNNTTDSEKTNIVAHISQLIGDEEMISALGINGHADVTVKMDENGVLHVQEIQSDDFMLEYHIRQSVEGVKMIVEDSLVGKTFSFIMNVVQSK